MGPMKQSVWSQKDVKARWEKEPAGNNETHGIHKLKENHLAFPSTPISCYALSLPLSIPTSSILWEASGLNSHRAKTIFLW